MLIGSRLLVVHFVLSSILLSVASVKCPGLECVRYACECNDREAVCEGVDSIPQCLPLATEVLVIRDSPLLTAVFERAFQQYRQLLSLSLIRTNVEIFHVEALSGLYLLKNLEISAASGLEEIVPGTFDDQSKITNIKITDCPKFKKIERYQFSNLVNLQELDLSNNVIEEVQNYSIYRCEGMRRLNLSHNEPLKHLERSAFSQLQSLQELSLSYCSLQELYPDHVDTPYEYGSLKNFDAVSNDWRCDDMCEFVSWVNYNPGFISVATMGTCSTPAEFQDTSVLLLSTSDVCPPVGIILGVIFGVIFLAIITPSIWKCYKRNCKASNSIDLNQEDQSNDDSPSRATGTQNLESHSNSAYEETEEASLEPTAPSRYAVDEKGGNDVDPPAYDVVAGNSEKMRSTQNKEVDFMEEIDPPSYDDHKLHKH